MNKASKEIKALAKLLNEYGYRVINVSQDFWTDELNDGTITLSIQKDAPTQPELRK